MKKKGVLYLAMLCGMVFLSGCLRYSTICEIKPTKSKSDTMTLEAASSFIKDAIENVPAGHHPGHPGDKVIGKYATSVRLRTHNRTGYILVEVFEGPRIMMEFYVRTREDGEKFADAVWRLRQEYRGK